MIKVEEKLFSIKPKSENIIELTLQPDGIGKLELELTSQKGVINAHIIASDYQSKNFIEQNLKGIIDALSKQGLSVGNFSVFLGDRGQGNRWERDDLTFNKDKVYKVMDVKEVFVKKVRNRKISLIA